MYFMYYVKGYRKYKDEGVEETKVVLDAIKEYRNDSDTLGRFMEECCTTSNSSISIKDLFKAYESWCNKNSEYKQFNRSNGLTTKLKGKGFTEEKLRKTSRKCIHNNNWIIKKYQGSGFKAVDLHYC